MGDYVPGRIEDMLRIYGDKAVADEQYQADRRCEELTDWQLRQARRRGEAKAWIIHDSYFIWERPLSNTFAELKAYVVADNHLAHHRVQDWLTLKAETIVVAEIFLVQKKEPVFPVLFLGEARTKWWKLVAIAHQCQRELREIL